MNAILELGKKIGSFIKDAIKLRSIDVTDIEEMITNIRDLLNIAKYIDTSLSAKEINAMITKYEKMAMGSKLKSAQIPLELHKRYNTQAKNMINKQGNVLAPIFNCIKRYQSILKEVDANIDKILIDKTLTLFNTHISQTALLGVMKQAEFYATYVNLLFSQIVRMVSGTEGDIPGYRIDFIIKHQEEFIRLTNLMCEKGGRYSFLGEINNIKRRNKNLLVHSKDQSISNILSNKDLNSSTMSYISSALPAFNIFLWVGEVLENYKHETYLKNKSMKEWIENHVALLRLELGGIDNADDPRYIKLQNIIDAYDANIAKYDKKINDYLNPDD